MASMDPETTGTAAQWIQAGGLALFAASIWIEVRALRSTLAELVKNSVATLEHVRRRPRTQPEDES